MKDVVQPRYMVRQALLKLAVWETENAWESIFIDLFAVWLPSQAFNRAMRTAEPQCLMPTSWWKIPKKDWPLPAMTFPRRLSEKHQGCGFDVSSTASKRDKCTERKQCPWSSAPHPALSWSLTAFWEMQGKWAASTKQSKLPPKYPT